MLEFPWRLEKRAAASGVDARRRAADRRGGHARDRLHDLCPARQGTVGTRSTCSSCSRSTRSTDGENCCSRRRRSRSVPWDSRWGSARTSGTSARKASSSSAPSAAAASPCSAAPRSGRWALPVILLAGIVGGAAWAAIPAVLRTRFNTSEILVSLMLVYIAQLLLGFLLHGAWRDPEGFNFPQSKAFDERLILPVLIEGQRATIAFLAHARARRPVLAVLESAVCGLPNARVGTGARRRSLCGLSREPQYLARAHDRRRRGGPRRGVRSRGSDRPAAGRTSPRATASPPSSSPSSAGCIRWGSCSRLCSCRCCIWAANRCSSGCSCRRRSRACSRDCCCSICWRRICSSVSACAAAPPGVSATHERRLESSPSSPAPSSRRRPSFMRRSANSWRSAPAS